MAPFPNPAARPASISFLQAALPSAVLPPGSLSAAVTIASQSSPSSAAAATSGVSSGGASSPATSVAGASSAGASPPVESSIGTSPSSAGGSQRPFHSSVTIGSLPA